MTVVETEKTELLKNYSNGNSVNSCVVLKSIRKTRTSVRDDMVESGLNLFLIFVENIKTHNKN